MQSASQKGACADPTQPRQLYALSDIKIRDHRYPFDAAFQMKILLILSDGTRKGPLEDLDVLSAFVRGKLPRDTLVKPVTSDAGWTEIGTYFSSRNPADIKRTPPKSHGSR